jgi:[ribosomal protein S5]-alanine N-acetyltransferase
MQIETKRLILRRLIVADAPALFRTVGDPDVMQYWAGGADATIRATAQRIAEIAHHWKTHGFGDWGVVEKKSGSLIGLSGLHYIADMADVNIGYAFERTKWRQGFGFETCQAVLDFGFQELGLETIVAVIWPDNRASITFAEKLGLRFWKAFTWQGGKRVAYRLCRDKGIPGELRSHDRSHRR